ncbi:MAG: hypothetical protein ABI388_13220 [Bacteroidia bacterium]
MKQVVKEKRSGKPTLIRSTRKEGVKLNAEATKTMAQSFASNKNHKTNTHLTVAEDSIDCIIGFFNEQALIMTDFEINSLKAIKGVGFAYPTDNAELQSLINNHIAHSKKTSAKGMKSILDTFTDVSLNANFEKGYFEEIDFITENPIENNYSSWIEQTIEEPWFKN